MTIYKVSYVVQGEPESGAILSRRTEPKVGEEVILHGKRYKVAEVIELMPPIDNVAFLHVTLKPAEKTQAAG